MGLKKDEEAGIAHYIIINFKHVSGKELMMSSIESVSEIFQIKHLLSIEAEEHLIIIEAEEHLPIIEVEDDHYHHGAIYLHHQWVIIHLIQMYPISHLHLMQMLQIASRKMRTTKIMYQFQLKIIRVVKLTFQVIIIRVAKLAFQVIILIWII